MKCKVCKCKTTWNTSVGWDNFIVCNDCWQKIAVLTDVSLSKALSIVLIMGDIKAGVDLDKKYRKKLKSSCNLTVDSDNEKQYNDYSKRKVVNTMTIFLTVLITVFVYQTILFLAINFDKEDEDLFLIFYLFFWSVPILIFGIIRKAIRKVKKHKK